jgi:hypothetical protein
VVTLALLAAACGGDDSTGSDDSSGSEPAPVEGTITDPRLEQVCFSLTIFDAINALYSDLPAEPAELRAAVAGIADDIAASREAAPATMHEDLDALAEWWALYAATWEQYDYDLDMAEAAPTDPFALVLGPASQDTQLAATWVGIANNLCVDDYDAWCDELSLTEARCRCVEEAYVTAAVETGLPRKADGSLDVEPITQDCPDSYEDRLEDWCGAYPTVAAIEDFVLDGDRPPRSQMTEEIVTGEFSSQEEDLVELVETAEAYVEASPEGVAPVVQALADWVRDYDEFWAEFDYAYARILDDQSATDAYLALNDEDGFSVTIPALIALEDTLCGGRDAFEAGCVLEGGTEERCGCVWSEVAQAVLADGVPLGDAANSIDVDAMTADCDEV